MRSMTGYIGVAAAVAIAVPATARAQQVPTVAQRDSAMVLDHTFNAPVGEPARVFLAKGVKYRVVIRGNGIQLQLRSIAGSVQQPLIEPFMAGQSAAEETVYNVTPRADAEYEFITTGGDPGMPISLHVYAVNPPRKKSP